MFANTTLPGATFNFFHEPQGGIIDISGVGVRGNDVVLSVIVDVTKSNAGDAVTIEYGVIAESTNV